MKSLIAAIIASATLATGHAADYITNQVYTAVGGSFRGGTIQTLGIACYVPNGSAPGDYAFNTGPGQIFQWVSVNGAGISNQPTPPAHTTALPFKNGTGEASFDVPRTINLYCWYAGHTSDNGGAGVLVGSLVVKKTYSYDAGWPMGTVNETWSYIDIMQTNAPVVKHPQPLNFTFENKSLKSATLIVKSPSGATVLTAGVGKGQTYTGGWDPPDGAALGTYTMYFGYVDSTGNGPVSITGSTILSTAPAESEFSKVWSDPTGSGLLEPDGKAGPDSNSPNGTIANNTDGTKTIQWKDGAGNVVATTVIPPGANGGFDPSSIPAQPAYSTLELTATDAATGAKLGTVTVHTFGDGIGPTYSGTVNHTFPGTTPTASTPITPPTAPATGTFNPSVPSRPSTPTGTTPGATAAETYAAVRNALHDEADASSMPAITNTAPDDLTAGMSERGKLDEIQNVLDNAASDAGRAQSGLKGKLTTFANTSWIPTSGIGTMSSLALGSHNIMGTTLNIAFDFTQYSTVLGIIRMTILFVTAIAMTVICVRMVREYL